MTETGTSEVVTGYLTSLRAALADLPPSEVEEILDDVGPHVAEVAAELAAEPAPEPGEPATGTGDADGAGLIQRLHGRLGAPEQYAAELRAAAGYPPRPEAATTASPALARLRVALWLLVASTVLVPLFALATGAGVPGNLPALLLAAIPAALSLLIVLRHPGGIGALAELPEARWLRARAPGGAAAEYGRLLQPGWWLVRAGVAALLVVTGLWAAPGWLVLLVAVPMIIGSVWLGRRSQADRRWLWAVLPLNAFAVVAGLALLGDLPRIPVNYVDYGGGPAQPSVAPGFANIYPYDSNGRPLTGVFLYDENGQPIVATYPAMDWGCKPYNLSPVPANQYPQPVYELNPYGECVRRSQGPTPSALPSATASATQPTGTPAPSSAPPSPPTPTS